MIAGTVLFTAGVVALQWQSDLLPVVLLWPLLLLSLAGWYRPRWRLICAFLIGFTSAALHGHWALASLLPAALEGQELDTLGIITSLPLTEGRRTGFQFRVETASLEGQAVAFGGLTRIAWYGNHPPLQVGQRWHLRLRLKRLHGMYNPGSFDYQGWLFQQGIRATGYVRSADTNQRLSEDIEASLFDRWRLQVGRTIDQTLAGTAGAGLLRALVIGDREGISQQQWEIFRRSGTNHLVAISGLHIGIVAGWVLLIGGRLWRLSGRLCQWIAAPRAAAVMALVAALLYAGLSGFGVPAVRALVMLMTVLGGVIAARPVRPFSALCIALLVILLYDPMAVLSAGFWLSFVAVAVILAGIGGRLTRPLERWRSLLRVQWLVTLGLAPLLLLWNLGVSPLAPLVNLLAVPLFSLLLVPLALLGALVSSLTLTLGAPMLVAAGWLLQMATVGLGKAAGLPFDLITSASLPLWCWLASFMAVVLILLPRGVPGRWLSLLLLLPLVSYQEPPLAEGEVVFTLLDVGQGLAAVIQTRNHTLLYDAGPRFSSGFNAGESVVLPYLRQRGISSLDKAVVSNGDMDHRGGIGAVVSHLPVEEVISGEPGRITVADVRHCQAGEEWLWDGVIFRLIHPGVEADWRGNNASCVLLVESPGGRILLTGDIEREAEAALLATAPADLAADLVVVPHHGSRTSSTLPFVRAVSARWALVSSGYRNRYGFPLEEVVGRWRSQGGQVFNTAQGGALTLRLGGKAPSDGPQAYRKRARRYWMAAAEGVGEK